MSGSYKEKAMILGTGFVVEPDGSAHPTQRGVERLDRALRHYYDMGERVMLLCSGGYSALAAILNRLRG